jgi:diaminopimelate epimerase
MMAVGVGMDATDTPEPAGLPETLEFAKGHGTGNDFVIIPDPHDALNLPPAVVAALCDRRFGLGGDGVLRVVPATAYPPAAASAARWFMDYRNADGSVAEMCGNGARVFARYLVESGLVDGGEFPMATRTGVVAARVTGGEVTVTMTRPRVYGRSVATLGGRGAASGRELAGVAVDCGNPHLVCPLPPDLALSGLDLTVPPAVDAGFFPAGVNVEFTSAGEGVPGADTHVRMRVYERGVGETLSCGSGACAVAAATGAGLGTAVVDVPGGRLRVALTAAGCELTGPATVVARGTLVTDRLWAVPGGDAAAGAAG